MQQLILDLAPKLPPDFDRFVVGQNYEALVTLQSMVTHPATMQSVYLWSDTACGRSYLLQACARFAQQHNQHACFYRASEVDHQLPEETNMLLIVDDVQQLSADGQIALFNAFNRAAHKNYRILLSGNTAPSKLILREDLRTRIGQMLIYRLHALDDQARAQLLEQLANTHKLTLNAAQVRYILYHAPRDPHSLARLVMQLDEASLQRQASVTVPLVRDIIAAGHHEQRPAATSTSAQPNEAAADNAP